MSAETITLFLLTAIPAEVPDPDEPVFPEAPEALEGAAALVELVESDEPAVLVVPLPACDEVCDVEASDKELLLHPLIKIAEVDVAKIRSDNQPAVRI